VSKAYVSSRAQDTRSVALSCGQRIPTRSALEGRHGMTSITPDDDYDWRDHQSSWLDVTVAFLTVLLALASITLL
jgi:hypothetical protein